MIVFETFFANVLREYFHFTNEYSIIIFQTNDSKDILIKPRSNVDDFKERLLGSLKSSSLVL